MTAEHRSYDVLHEPGATVPIKMWTRGVPVDEGSKRQLLNTASMPFIYKWLAVMPDVHYGNEEHFVDEAAQTGMSKWLLTGTARDGTRRKVHGCDFYTFRDDKVIRKDSYWKIVE